MTAVGPHSVSGVGKAYWADSVLVVQIDWRSRWDGRGTGSITIVGSTSITTTANNYAIDTSELSH